MDKHWILSPVDGAAQLTEESWLRVIQTDDRLTSRPSRQVPNPFEPGAQMEIRPDPCSVVVIADGNKLGSIGWSEDESPGLIASCEQEDNWARMQALVQELAQQFSCNIEEVIE